MRGTEVPRLRNVEFYFYLPRPRNDLWDTVRDGAAVDSKVLRHIDLRYFIHKTTTHDLRILRAEICLLQNLFPL